MSKPSKKPRRTGKKTTKYIFVVGGVMSGVGKGVASASIGRLLKSRGFAVTAMKIDPYVNVDAGTMNPTEHGEVFVLDDGAECDQDMGNYERFLETTLTRDNYLTTGSLYKSVIEKERALKYKGKCVEVVPHIPFEIIDNINRARTKNKAEIVIVEIGGTVGEYQNILFLEAVRMLKQKRPNDVLLALVSFLPYQGKSGELKTKPTQYAVRTLNSAGLQPDVVIARAGVALDKKRKEKIAVNCNLHEEDVISAPDIESIYEVPVNFEKDKITDRILTKLHMVSRMQDLRQWKQLVRNIQGVKKEIKIGVVGKYFATGSFVLEDSYISVLEAIKHAAFGLKRRPVISWLNADDFDPTVSKNYAENLKALKKFNGIIVPGGFGSRGIEGKIEAIGYCRKERIPFLGLCYGMQLAVVEFARNIARMKDANTTEVDAETPFPVIDILPDQKEKLASGNMGGSMRLGAYPAHLKKNSVASTAYESTRISERHRHRYEVNPKYISRLEKKGLVFSGYSPDKHLMEIIELSKEEHPFFVATQFHPEFKSRPLNPHPLFLAFMRASFKKGKK